MSSDSSPSASVVTIFIFCFVSFFQIAHHFIFTSRSLWFLSCLSHCFNLSRDCVFIRIWFRPSEISVAVFPLCIDWVSFRSGGVFFCFPTVLCGSVARDWCCFPSLFSAFVFSSSESAITSFPTLRFLPYVVLVHSHGVVLCQS